MTAPKYYYVVVDAEGEVLEQTSDKEEALKFFREIVKDEIEIERQNKRDFRLKRLVFEEAFSLIRYRIDKTLKTWDKR